MILVKDGMHIIKDIKEIFSNYDFGTQILVASIRHPIHVVDAAKIGADVVTLPPAVLDKDDTSSFDKNWVKKFPCRLGKG